ALRAGLAAEQVDLEGVEKGVAGQAGHAKVDKAHVGAVAGSYDAGAAGGTVVASAKDVALEGIAATSESRLAALKHQIAVLEAEAAPADPAVHAGKLAKARRQMKAYERLEKQQRAAKTKAAKARAAKALAAWSEEVELTVREAGVTDVDVRATGLGSGKLAAEAHIAGEAHATGIKRGDLGVGSVRGQGMLVKVDATDPAMGTTVAARADHVEAEQVTAGSARVKKATLDGASLVATDERTAMGAKKAQVRGVRAGGASVASATLNDADLTTRTDARGNDHVSASARSAWAYDVRSRGKGHDARVKHVAGSGLAVSAGGGHTSASLASFKARDASVATGEGDQQSVVAADKVSGTGASFSAGGGKVRAGVKTLEGSGLAAAGAMTGGRFVTVDEAKIADASMSADKQAGSMKADVGSLTAAGVRSVKADGSEVVTADKAALGGVHVLSKDVAIEDDAGAAVVGPDGKPLSRRVSSVDVEKASVEGGAAKLTDKATGAVTEVATKKTEVEGASAMMDGSKIAGHVDRVEGDVAYSGSKPITLPNGQQVTRASGHVKATGLGGEVDTATGDVSASFGTIKANRLTFGDGDRKVALLKSLSLGKAGETSTVSLSGGKVSGDLWAVRVVTDDDVAVPIGPGLNAAVTGKLGVGRIQLKKVDPGDLAAAGSSVKIEGIAASLRIATPDGKIAWVDDAVVGQIAAQGMGGGKLAVGYDWVTAKSFGVKDGEKGKTKVENFGLRDGYAEVQLGSDPKVLTAWLGEVKGDVHVSATIDKSKAKAKNDGSPAAPAASPGTSGPKERDDLILDVLKESDLTIPMKTKGSAGLETNIEMWAKAHDGKIPLKDANISAEWGYLHAGTGDGISRSLIRNVVAPDFVAFDDAGSIDVDRTVRRLATDQGPSPDGEKDEGPSDFLTNLQVGVHSRNLKGRAGIVGKGEGRFEQGELSAGGKVADSVGAKLEYPIIRDVKVLDGLIEANRVYAEKMEVKVERPLDQTMVMKADIEAGKITGVEYGKRMSEADRKAAKDRVMQQ
ncbi:MAG: hypothetical protein KC635_14515, partial [Myxococcales bacterium]|nr:hypothetical protein [Myxococcales bacterium]